MLEIKRPVYWRILLSLELVKVCILRGLYSPSKPYPNPLLILPLNNKTLWTYIKWGGQEMEREGRKSESTSCGGYCQFCVWKIAKNLLVEQQRDISAFTVPSAAQRQKAFWAGHANEAMAAAPRNSGSKRSMETSSAYADLTGFPKDEAVIRIEP